MVPLFLLIVIIACSVCVGFIAGLVWRSLFPRHMNHQDMEEYYQNLTDRKT